jgi:uncharacterized protein (DUF1800 family)
VSPAAGYTQADVLATTYILTGWGVQRPDAWHKAGVPLGSRFNFDRHEPGSQTVMGKSYSALVNNDGKLKDLVDDLAAHPATARHICSKLAAAFLADEPPPAAVQRLTDVFTRTRGDLPSLHKTVVQEVARAGSSARKFQNPETWFWTLFRVSGVPLQVVPPQRELRGERPHDILWELGQPVHNCPQPNGWPLHSREWISREMLDRRLRYAYQFAGRIPDAAAALRRQLQRQLGPEHPLAQTVLAGMAPGSGHTVRSLWAAFFTSPEMLWS